MVYAVLLFCFFVLVWGMVIYNRFVSLARYADEAWSGIAVQLRRRHDLVPNLVQVVSGYAQHEKELFETVARLRREATVAECKKPTPPLEQAEGQLGWHLGQLLVVAEQYPDLRASENFMTLHNSLVELEDQIQMARRYYNGTIRNYNVLVESFPSLLVARVFRFTVRPFFTLDSAVESTVPQVGNVL